MNAWDEHSSETYRALAAVVVPHRAEQMAALLTLLPFAYDDAFHAVELASGEGRLAYAILRAFPNATVLALDLSESMRQETARRLAPFGERARVEAFDMAAHDWYGQLDGADAVVSSLCIHHLDAAGKQALFAAVGERLLPRGAFLIADLMLPQRPQAREWFAATYDAVVKDQAGDTALYDRFVRAGWNYYRFPDESDQPSPLFDQLTWLAKAGFYGVDCFWLQAGHAVFGGYKSAQGVEEGIAYEGALQIVREALNSQ
jgi:SAM-dependent methyltransferase